MKRLQFENLFLLAQFVSTRIMTERRQDELMTEGMRNKRLSGFYSINVEI